MEILSFLSPRHDNLQNEERFSIFGNLVQKENIFCFFLWFIRSQNHKTASHAVTGDWLGILFFSDGNTSNAFLLSNQV